MTVDQQIILRQYGDMTDQTMAVDGIDRRIIGILQHHGRISWRELADAVHMASSSVADRVRRLEAAGVIRDYRASIDPAALGRNVRAVIDVSLPAGGDPAQFEARLAERDEVELALYVTGPADYTVIVDCVGAEGLDGFIRWLKAEGGVARTESKFVLRPVIG
jgi:Lrp/AsnC family leucine-responsive transcriptional regulator